MQRAINRLTKLERATAGAQRFTMTLRRWVALWRNDGGAPITAWGTKAERQRVAASRAQVAAALEDFDEPAQNGCAGRPPSHV